MFPAFGSTLPTHLDKAKPSDDDVMELIEASENADIELYVSIAGMFYDTHNAHRGYRTPTLDIVEFLGEQFGYQPLLHDLRGPNRRRTYTQSLLWP